MFVVKYQDADMPEYADHPMNKKYFAGKNRIISIEYEDIKIKVVISYPNTYIEVAGLSYPMPKLLTIATDIDPSLNMFKEISHAIDYEISTKISKTAEAFDLIWKQ